MTRERYCSNPYKTQPFCDSAQPCASLRMRKYSKTNGKLWFDGVPPRPESNFVENPWKTKPFGDLAILGDFRRFQNAVKPLENYGSANLHFLPNLMPRDEFDG